MQGYVKLDYASHTRIDEMLAVVESDIAKKIDSPLIHHNILWETHRFLLRFASG